MVRKDERAFLGMAPNRIIYASSRAHAYTPKFVQAAVTCHQPHGGFCVLRRIWGRGFQNLALYTAVTDGFACCASYLV